jgi:hypothetical protein
MTLNELIKLVPVDHHDSPLIVYVGNKRFKLEFSYIYHFGLDNSRIVFGVKNDS